MVPIILECVINPACARAFLAITGASYAIIQEAIKNRGGAEGKEAREKGINRFMPHSEKGKEDGKLEQPITDFKLGDRTEFPIIEQDNRPYITPINDDVGKGTKTEFPIAEDLPWIHVEEFPAEERLPIIMLREKYESGPNDLDWRGTGKDYKDALQEAFGKTGVPKEEFEVTKWASDKHGKSFPVEWKHKESKSKVSVDDAHEIKESPDVSHVGWETGKKPKTTGHILLDDVPINRGPKQK